MNKFALAACLGMSNLGMHVDENVQQRAANASNLRDAVERTMAAYVETDEMLEDFVQEAESWYDTLKEMNDADIYLNWHTKLNILLGGNNNVH